jgi:hypothetical protein
MSEFVAFNTPVRGHRYAGRPGGAEPPRAGQSVALCREHGHPRDPWAVAVWVGGEDSVPWRIGYLERAVAARIGPRIDRGEDIRAHIAGWAPEPSSRWWRPVARVAPGSGRDGGAAPPGSRVTSPGEDRLDGEQSRVRQELRRRNLVDAAQAPPRRRRPPPGPRARRAAPAPPAAPPRGGGGPPGPPPGGRPARLGVGDLAPVESVSGGDVSRPPLAFPRGERLQRREHP